jgi:hypothetical protein
MAEITEKIRTKLLEVDDFADFPEWFITVLARRLLLILIPTLSSKNLPRWLSTIINSPIDNWPPGALPPSDTFAPPVIPGYDPGPGPIAPIYTPPFTPGPPHTPHPSPSPGAVEIDIDCTYQVALSGISQLWADAHGATDSTYIDTNNGTIMALTSIERAGAWRTIQRTVLTIPLTDIPAGATITSASITLYCIEYDPINIRIQKAPSCDRSKTDYSRMSGVPSAPLLITIGAYNTWTLTDDQRSYLQDNINGEAYLMFRDSQYDVANIEPAPGTFQGIRCDSPVHADPTKRPFATITYKV